MNRSLGHIYTASVPRHARQLDIVDGGFAVVRDAAKTLKSLVAEYPDNYVAEKEGGILRIYLTSQIEVEPFGRGVPHVVEPPPLQAQDNRRQQIRSVADLSARAKQIFRGRAQ
jgi:hypothetical protein